jgi:hypothetical protein
MRREGRRQESRRAGEQESGRARRAKREGGSRTWRNTLKGAMGFIKK